MNDIAEEHNPPTEKKVSMTKKKRFRHTRGPLIAAAGIFAATACFFGAWKCFFDSTLDGTWGVELTVPNTEEKVYYRFSFLDNNTVRYQSGGQAAIGRYYLNDDDNSHTLNMSFTNGGAVMNAQFGYSFSGNIFTGRQLSLKDISGFFFAPDTADSDETQVKAKKTITDSVEENGTTYYVWNLTPAEEKFRQDKTENFTPDKKLVGIWYAKAEDESQTSYTIVFNEDGSFEQRNFESEIYGRYFLSDNKCTIRYYAIDSNEMGAELDYSVSEGKLTLGTHEFVKTNDKYAYASEN